jgi:malate dehydrogenase (oxaloacetate-decarboxylating)
MSSTSPGYGITIRVEGPPSAQPVAEVTNAIVAAGASITALDVVESHLDRVVIDVTCDAIDADHAEAISAAISLRPDLTVRKVSDRTFLLHLGGKIEIRSKVPLKTRDDLSRAYTPGVARISQAIANDPSDARRLTIKRNTVAVVTDGSAVLGLGNIGPAAALPVMEGKAALFKRGVLDGRITKISDAMLVAASDAISQCVSSEQLNANFIIPSVFDARVVQDVAAAVRKFG